MKKLLFGACCFLLAGAFVTTAVASDEEETLGELHIKMNSDYATVTVNGNEWEAVEFTNKGKTAIVKRLSLTEDTSVELTPSYEELEPATVDVTPKDFKRKRVKGGFVMRAVKVVKFAKKKADAPAPKKPDAPKPKPDKPKPDDGQSL